MVLDITMPNINCKPLPASLDAFDIQRFWGKVDKSIGQGPNGECWEWKGGVDRKEYGKFQIKKQQYIASRISMFISSGIDPFPLQALHSCDNPRCCRPDHLRAGTQADNMRDAWGRGRMKSNITPELRKGENNPAHKLTEAQVADLREKYWNGSKSQRDLGQLYGVSQSVVHNIISGKTWRHVVLVKSENRQKAIPNGKFSTKPVLTEDEVREIRNLYHLGQYTQTDLGMKFNVSGHTISCIVRRKIHKEVV